MTNKEFQNILAQYPDDYTIQMDNAFGWETPSNKHMVDPHLYINTDFGFIEIEPPTIRDIWVKPEEGLPKDLAECIFIKKYDIEDGVTAMVNEMGTYHADSKTFRYWDFYNDEEVKVPADEIAAYMVIPKYDEESGA